jgi:hypothetical protein
MGQIFCATCGGEIQDSDGYYPVTYLANTENSDLCNKLYMYGSGITPISLTTKQWTDSAPSYLGEYDEFLEGRTIYEAFKECCDKYSDAYDKESGYFLNGRSIGDESDEDVIEYLKKSKLTSPQTAKNTAYYCNNSTCSRYGKETVGVLKFISYSTSGMNVLGH